MGYTPLFDTLTSGTLCGRWPDIGLWPIVLSLADKNGTVDVTPTYIASITGLPVEDVEACMERFCQPDKYSRSQEHDGCRLTLIDPERPWGWQVVNHGKYREKARLAAKNAREVESGKNKARMDRRSPPETAADPLRPTPQTQTKTRGKSKRGAKRARLAPEDFLLTPELREWATTEAPGLDVEAEYRKFMDHEFDKPKSDWTRTFRNWIRKAKQFNGTNQRNSAPRNRLSGQDERLRQWAESGGA